MSCCPDCPDDFKVKNVPDEVECLVTNLISGLQDTNGFLDLRNKETILNGAEIPYGTNVSLVNLSDASLIGVAAATVFIDGASAGLKGTSFKSEEGTLYVVLNQ